MPLDTNIKEKLIDILSEDWVKDDEVTLYTYRCDGLTLYNSLPMGVVFPETVKELVSVVKLFYTLGSIIIPGLIIPFINALTRKNNAINSYFSLLWLCIPVAVSLIWYILDKFSIELISNLEPFYPGIFTSMIFYLVLLLSSKDNRLIYDSMSSE